MPPLEVISDARIPIKMWIRRDDVEPDAVKQLLNVANLPVSVKHVAVMPDVHVGYGATVGTVMVTKDAIVPSAVGVDIGCGMMATQTNLNVLKVEGHKNEIVHSIMRSVPTGFESNRELTDDVKAWMANDHLCPRVSLFHPDAPGETAEAVYEKAALQIGTLGGGNHFIEICRDEADRVWVMLHSGSRGIGNRLATRHTKIAKELMNRYHIKLDDPYLAYLPQGEAEFQDYWDDLMWAQTYAMENRAEMMRKVLKDLSYAVNDGKEVERVWEVNCHHNYAARENHFGDNVIVVRKGAIRARLDDYGIIPGSMGVKSFITRGKGDPQSFHSCSHGAGRKMSRKRAKQEFTVADLEAQTAGIACRKDAGVLDEIPGAYKDIDVVMGNQVDLVEPIHTLRQIACIKGGKG